MKGKKLLKMLAVGAFALLLAPAFAAVCLAASEESLLSYRPASGREERVELQRVSEEYYLFLPSAADCSALPLCSELDGVLYGRRESDGITLPAGETVTADLSSLAGGMKAGEKYGFTLKNAKGSFPITVMRSESLSSLHILLEKDLSLIHKSKDKSEESTGSYALIKEDGTVSSAGAIERFKGRGNSSWTDSKEKRPYSMKLTTAKELIEGAGRSKKWCLLSDNVQLGKPDKHDVSGLCNKIALGLYRELGARYATDSQNVDLYINGEYRGTYLLSESISFSAGTIDIDDPVCTEDTTKLCRVVQAGGMTVAPKYWVIVPPASATQSVVKLDDNAADPAIAAGIQAYQYSEYSTEQYVSGYLLQIDSRFYQESAWFITRLGIPFVIDTPGCPSQEFVRKLAIYVQGVEDALVSSSGYNARGEYYAELLDLDAQAKMFLVDNFMVNLDAQRTSTYYYGSILRDGSVGKLCAGPAWDYNYHFIDCTTLFNAYCGSNNFTIPWYEALITHGDFLSAVSRLNTEVFTPLTERLIASDYADYVSELSASEEMNHVLWRNDFAHLQESLFLRLKKRNESWKTLWSGEVCTGVRISESGGKLKAEADGSVSSYQWYRVDPAAGCEGVAIEGATDAVYKPESPGIYYCSVTGGNIAYNVQAGAERKKYTQHGITSITAERELAFASESVTVTK